MSEEEQKPDLGKLACKIAWRLNLLSGRTDAACIELAELSARIREALETNDAAMQWELMDDVKSYLDGSAEVHEDIRNVFQMYFYYVHLRNGVDASGCVWWTRVG